MDFVAPPPPRYAIQQDQDFDAMAPLTDFRHLKRYAVNAWDCLVACEKNSREMDGHTLQGKGCHSLLCLKCECHWMRLLANIPVQQKHDALDASFCADPWKSVKSHKNLTVTVNPSYLESSAKWHESIWSLPRQESWARRTKGCSERRVIRCYSSKFDQTTGKNMPFQILWQGFARSICTHESSHDVG